MSFRLSQEQVQSTLEMLEREQRLHPRSRFERWSFPLLQIFVTGYVVTGLPFLLITWFGPAHAEGKLATTMAVLLALYIVFSVLAILLFVLNLIVARRMRRQLRVLHYFGVLQVLDDPWKAERRRAGLGRFFSSVLLIVGIAGTLGSLSALAVLVLVATFSRITFGEKVPLGLGMSAVLMTSLLLVGYYFLRRAHLRHRLVYEAGRLRKLLETKHASEDGFTVVESKFYQELVAAERASIAQGREAAIERSLTRKDSASRPMAIARSQALVEQQASLAPEEALAVEHCIQRLASEPRPEGVQRSAPGDRLVLPVKGTRSALVYTVDEEARRVTIFDLRRTAADAAGHPSRGVQRA